MVSFVHHSFSVRTTFGQRFVCIRTSFGKRTYIVRASSVHGSGIVRIVNFYVTRTVTLKIVLSVLLSSAIIDYFGSYLATVEKIRDVRNLCKFSELELHGNTSGKNNG